MPSRAPRSASPRLRETATFNAALNRLNQRISIASGQALRARPLRTARCAAISASSRAAHARLRDPRAENLQSFRAGFPQHPRVRKRSSRSPSWPFEHTDQKSRDIYLRVAESTLAADIRRR
jgi:hypothetical protein